LNTFNNKTLNQILCEERGNKIHKFWNSVWSGRSTWDSADSGLKSCQVEEKIEEEKTQYDSTDLARYGQKPGCNPLTFVFILLKWCRFKFFLKKLTRMTWWLGQNLKLGSWTKPVTERGLKTMRRMVRNYSIKNRLIGNKDKLQIIAPNCIMILEFCQIFWPLSYSNNWLNLSKVVLDIIV